MNVSRQIPFVASATALALALTIARPLAAPPDGVVPPPVPGILEAPSGHTAFLIGRAYGTQSYSCLPSQGVIKWLPAGPQATVFDADGRQILTHYLSPNPEESGTPRATWQHSRDTSAVWASALVETYAEPDFVAPGAIPWLRIAVGGRRYGPAWGEQVDPGHVHPAGQHRRRDRACRRLRPGGGHRQARVHALRRRLRLLQTGRRRPVNLRTSPDCGQAAAGGPAGSAARRRIAPCVRAFRCSSSSS